jgi:hypothetical protein
MLKPLALVLAGLTAFATGAMAQQAQSAAAQRLRGAVTSVQGDRFTLRSQDGKDARITIGSDTRFATLSPASLSDIKQGDFIGTAAKGPVNDLVALEVVVFPESLRGSGEGHYPWDELPDRTVAGGQGGSKATPMVQSSMTNGTVTTAPTPNTTPRVASSMTNGTVTTDTSKTGGKELTVTYKGQKAQVLVPPDVPVVRIAPASRSALTTGSNVFVRATRGPGDDLHAVSIAIGQNGVTPPM